MSRESQCLFDNLNRFSNRDDPDSVRKRPARRKAKRLVAKRRRVQSRVATITPA